LLGLTQIQQAVKLEQAIAHSRLQAAQRSSVTSKISQLTLLPEVSVSALSKNWQGLLDGES
jgi:hypothetical protein